MKGLGKVYGLGITSSRKSSLTSTHVQVGIATSALSSVSLRSDLHHWPELATVPHLATCVHGRLPQ